jgi:hypothetical protein
VHEGTVAGYKKHQTHPHHVNLRKAKYEGKENEGRDNDKFDFLLRFSIKIPGNGIPLCDSSSPLTTNYMKTRLTM